MTLSIISRWRNGHQRVAELVQHDAPKNCQDDRGRANRKSIDAATYGSREVFGWNRTVTFGARPSGHLAPGGKTKLRSNALPATTDDGSNRLRVDFIQRRSHALGD